MKLFRKTERSLLLQSFSRKNPRKQVWQSLNSTRRRIRRTDARNSEAIIPIDQKKIYTITEKAPQCNARKSQELIPRCAGCQCLHRTRGNFNGKQIIYNLSRQKVKQIPGKQGQEFRRKNCSRLDCQSVCSKRG